MKKILGVRIKYLLIHFNTTCYCQTLCWLFYMYDVCSIITTIHILQMRKLRIDQCEELRGTLVKALSKVSGTYDVYQKCEFAF